MSPVLIVCRSKVVGLLLPLPLALERYFDAVSVFVHIFPCIVYGTKLLLPTTTVAFNLFENGIIVCIDTRHFPTCYRVVYNLLRGEIGLLNI